MNEKGSPILLIVCILVMAGVCGGLFYFRNGLKETEVPVPQFEDTSNVVKVKPVTELPVVEKPSKLSVELKTIVEQAVTFDSSSEIAQNFEHGLEKIESVADLENLLSGLGAKNVPSDQLELLFEKIGKKGANLKRGNVIDEIGELERKKRSRWSINLEDGSRIFFDMKRGDDGKWLIEKVHKIHQGHSSLEAILEEGNVAQLDGLMVAHSFVQFAIQQDFVKAKQLVDVSKMSDVQLAGLCIIFDEGGYILRKPRGVLTSIHKPLVSGYSVYITSQSDSVAQFSLLLSRKKPIDPWRVSELNFNTLLSEFIKASGGDSYYTPFVKNPQGGDSIVVYFDFNTNQLSPRTERQLSIVANILKLDKARKITLTGHTDAVGGADYNRKLSQRRANAVRDYLVEQGVGTQQIETIGFGAYRPREANTFADGSDNPDGRKANRRTEIYLDF